jgi:hypothetical protein
MLNAPAGWNVACKRGPGHVHSSLGASRWCAWVADGSPAYIRYDFGNDEEDLWHVADIIEHTFYGAAHYAVAMPLCDDWSGDYPVHTYTYDDAESIVHEVPDGEPICGRCARMASH